MLRELKRLFPNNSNADVAAALGCGVEAAKKKASRLGLKKSQKYRKSVLHLK